jgi:hypothetical protein
VENANKYTDVLRMDDHHVLVSDNGVFVTERVSSLPSTALGCIHGEKDEAGLAKVLLVFFKGFSFAVFIHPRKYFKYLVSIMLF